MSFPQEQWTPPMAQPSDAEGASSRHRRGVVRRLAVVATILALVAALLWTEKRNLTNKNRADLYATMSMLIGSLPNMPVGWPSPETCYDFEITTSRDFQDGLARQNGERSYNCSAMSAWGPGLPFVAINSCGAEIFSDRATCFIDVVSKETNPAGEAEHVSLEVRLIRDDEAPWDWVVDSIDAPRPSDTGFESPLLAN